MAQCKSYKEKTNIKPDIFSGKVQVNCANCWLWNGERCSNEAVVVASQDPDLLESLEMCDW